MHTIEVVSLEGEKTHRDYDRVSDTCPICHISVSPKVFFGTILRNHHVQILFQCTKAECKEFFIGTYYRDRDTLFRYRRSAPKTPRKAVVPESIQKISPTFAEVYNQAQASEAFELSQLTGIGLRKALEFLIKDFAITRIDEDEDEEKKKEEEIRAMFLGVCINKYIDDRRLKATAHRASWLGNDETHYTRRWEDKDIEDLKVLIRLTMNWVENVLLTDEYTDSMPSN